MKILFIFTLLIAMLFPDAGFAEESYTNYTIQDINDGVIFCDEVIKPTTRECDIGKKYHKKCLNVYLTKMHYINSLSESSDKVIAEIIEQKKQEEIFLRYPQHNVLISNILNEKAPKKIRIKDPLLRDALGLKKSLRDELIGF